MVLLCSRQSFNQEAPKTVVLMAESLFFKATSAVIYNSHMNTPSPYYNILIIQN